MIGRSIYDGDEDGDQDDDHDGGAEDPPWFLRPAEEEDAAEAPLRDRAQAPGEDVASGPAGLNASVAAIEGEAAPLIHAVARRLGRLDGLIAAGAPVARLRAMEVADLMWRRGRAVRAERLALYEVDGGAPRGDNPEDYAVAFQALRRLRAPLDLSGPEDLRAWLGWGRGAPPAALAEVMEMRDEAEVDRALAGWLALRASLADRSAPARAAALAAAWAGDPAFGRDRDVAASLLAARLAVEDGAGESRAGENRAGAGAPFLPVAIGARRGDGPAVLDRVSPTAAAVAAIPDWLAAMRDAADRALLDLGALAAWRDRAGRAAAGMRGRTPKALVGALHDHLALSASMAAAEIGGGVGAADAALKKYEAAGLARELTGGAKWRFWTAAL